jgi:hypothetical protein
LLLQVNAIDLLAGAADFPAGAQPNPVLTEEQISR